MAFCEALVGQPMRSCASPLQSRGDPPRSGLSGRSRPRKELLHVSSTSQVPSNRRRPPRPTARPGPTLVPQRVPGPGPDTEALARVSFLWLTWGVGGSRTAHRYRQNKAREDIVLIRPANASSSLKRSQNRSGRRRVPPRAAAPQGAAARGAQSQKQSALARTSPRRARATPTALN